jgi:hypothetical protein
MSTERFNRQFILLDFADLDNPEYLAFVRAPEFSTYLLMRRHVWRATAPHHMGLDRLYRDGLLACSLDREKMAEQLGGVTTRTISNDLTALERRGVITVTRTGRQNIYVVGRWGEEDGVRYEVFFVDRLHVREEENFTSTEKGTMLPPRDEESFTSGVRSGFASDGQVVSASNREGNREENREAVEDSKILLQELLNARTMLAPYVEDIARELHDEAPVASSIGRALNLYGAARLTPDEFVAAMMAARATAQRRTPNIRKQRAGGQDTLAAKNKMPYFFAVLEELVGGGAAAPAREAGEEVRL